MKVTIAERTLHFKQPAGTSRGVYTIRKSWMVTICDGDKRGVGECAPLPDLSCDALPDYGTTLRHFCDNVERTRQLPLESLRDYPSMLFGLETAMLNLQNGHQLFDTPFSRGEEGITINGLVWMGTFEEMYHRIEEKLQAGFRCVKLKIGAIDWERELSLIRFIRQHFTPADIELRVDANGGFSPEDAPRKLEQLARYGIHSIEQPIRQHQWKAMVQLCRNTPVPIALDEELIGVNSLEEKQRLLDTIRPQYIILKPSLHGGISGTCEWISMARQRGIPSWITSALESNVGLNAVAQLAAHVYGPHVTFPQGLGTGQLFTDNIPMPLQLRGDQLWYGQHGV